MEASGLRDIVQGCLQVVHIAHSMIQPLQAVGARRAVHRRVASQEGSLQGNWMVRNMKRLQGGGGLYMDLKR